MKKVFVVWMALSSVLSLAQAPDFLPQEDLIAWYAMGAGSMEGSGLVPLQPVVFAEDRFGEADECILFDGEQELTTSGLSYSDFTISLWFRSEASSEDVCHGLISQNTGVDCTPLMHVASCNIPPAIRCQVRTTSCLADQVSAELNVLSWQHLVFQRQGNTIRTFLNGDLAEEGAAIEEDILPDVPLRIGSLPYGGQFRGFKGLIDDVAIWGRSLSEEEVMALYQAEQLTTAQLPGYVPEEGLIAWYDLDGNATDLSGNENNGSLHGPAPAENRFGQSESCLEFNRDELDYISTDLDDIEGDGDRSMAFWARVDEGRQGGFALSYGPELFESSCNAGFHIELGLTDCGFVALGVGPNCYQRKEPVENLYDNSWHHYVITYAGGGLVTSGYWIDGELQPQTGCLDGSFPSSLNTSALLGLSIGRRNDDNLGTYFDGLIDEVGVWNRELTPNEIASLFGGEVPVSGCTSLEACNYNPEALLDDGSCLGLDACGECGGEGVAGCTALGACNYNPIASCDDGGCVYPPSINLGEDIETCEAVVTLDAGPGFENYLWTTGDTSQTIQVHEPGEYGVLGTLQLEQDALLFDGENDFVVTPANPSFNFETSLSFGVWVKIPPGNSGWTTVLGGYYDHGVNIYAGSGNSNGAVRVELPGVHTLTSNTDLRDNQWHHVMVIYDGSALSIWIDGQIEISEEASGNINPDNDGEGYDLYLGRGNHTGEYFTGAMAFPELWNIALSPESIQAHFQCPPSEENNGLVALWQFDENNGALAPDASGTGSDGQIFGAVYSSDVPSGLCSTQCHTSASDTINVQLFTYSCLCGEGAVWDEILGECVGEISPENACHDGTIWSETVGACVVANPSDTDFDGCVSMTDLLDLLSVFGTCAEEGPAVMEWLCGDPLEYHGYEYETVQIGEQCWFAENLRAESYQNGDFITSGMNNEEWSSATSGATAVYGDDPSNLDAFGRLYNFHVVEDNRLICPAMWHVPSDEEVIELENHLGMMPDEASAVGFRGGNIGDALKSTSGWNGDGNGTNVSGLNVVPSGNRYHHGAFLSLGENGSWWTSTQNQNDESKAWYRSLSHDDEGIYREQDALKTIGFPIRCIKDSE